ncbi:MAG: membrane protein insertion efficiency factor YidD [Bacillota bacterium]|nr:MAG: membrane protein insertion efficiency factor YidD [Bacillota bacterium]
MKTIGLFLIKFYQKCISPMLGSNCRYTPTCSQYALEAVLKHGFFKGCALAVWRVLRCNPFSKGGFDKVPDKKSVLKWVM